MWPLLQEASGKRGSASYKPLPYEKDQLYSSEKSVVNEENSDNPASYACTPHLQRRSPPPVPHSRAFITFFMGLCRAQGAGD